MKIKHFSFCKQKKSVMKTKQLILVVAGVIFILVGCSKEPIANLTKSESSVKKMAPPGYTLLDPYSFPEWWCVFPSTNCAPIVTIRPKTDGYDNFLNAVNNASGTDVANFFSSSNYSIWSSLFPFLVSNSVFLAKLQSGNFTFYSHVNDSTQVTIFVAHNSDKTDYFGIPVRH